MWAKLSVESLFERVNLASQLGVSREQKVAAADGIRMHENIGGIAEATASAH
jgi:hypothetical protein